MFRSGHPTCEILETLETGFPKSSNVDSLWTLSLGRLEEHDRLASVVSVPEQETFPRGYLESVVQRIELANRNPSCERIVPLSLPEEIGYAGRYVEGERWTDYLSRLGKSEAPLGYLLLLDAVKSISQWVDTPRILAGIRLSDFVVRSKCEIQTVAELDLLPGLFRLEKPLSDFQIGKRLAEDVACHFLAIESGWRDRPLSFEPENAKPFRRIVRELKAGRDASLEQRLADLVVVMTNVIRKMGIREREWRCFGGRKPIGWISRNLRKRFLSDQSNLCETGSNPRPGGKVGSSFVLPVSSPEWDQDRYCYLLPPEAWFGDSVVGALNRKLSHPFLRAHHNAIRTRAVYCDGGYTAALADTSIGLALPTLFAFREEVSFQEVVSLGEKIHRALSQFESANFQVDLRSPWQIEIHLETVELGGEWNDLLSRNLGEWPSWDVVNRVEIPVEARVDFDSSWNPVLEKFDGKFFPALICWMLDWNRFRWALENQNLQAEPMSWDKQLSSLFAAAKEHLDASDPGQRRKFLSLIREWADSATSVELRE